METFRPEVRKLLDGFTSRNTQNTYGNGVSSFVNFRLKHGLGDSWPPTVSDLVNYVAYMSCQGYAPATVKVYLSGLSYWLKVMGINDLTESFILQKMLKGMDNLYSLADTRKPITLELLIRIMNALTFVCSSVYETMLFRSAFSLAFFALLRVGEITIHTNTRHVINKTDVNFSSNLQSLYVTIPFSKTDQKGVSTTLIISKFDQESVCPVRLLLKYISVRHEENGPLFCHCSKTGITRYQFSKVLKKSLSFIGCNPDDYNTHSFRIGAATYFSLLGQTDEEIMSKGRWKSTSFKRYTHSIIIITLLSFQFGIMIYGLLVLH